VSNPRADLSALRRKPPPQERPSSVTRKGKGWLRFQALNARCLHFLHLLWCTDLLRLAT